MNKETFCKKLKQARQEANLKQADVAEFLSLPISAISVMESGDRKVDIFELIELAKFYKKPVEYFIYETQTHQMRRWYDKKPILSQAINLMQNSPDKLQEASALGIIGFLQNLISNKN